LAGAALDIEQYDVVFVGYPIWWYIAPTIINTFLESYDFSGKTIVPFATSGGSGMGAVLLPGKMLNGKLSESELKAWVEQF
jgi:putative NADPH-quinone reductase